MRLAIHCILVVAALLVTASASAQNGRIEIIPSRDFVNDSTFLAPGSPELTLKFTNNTGRWIDVISLGFKISTVGYWLGPTAPYIRAVELPDLEGIEYLYDVAFEVYNAPFTNAVDTIGFWAQATPDYYHGMSSVWSDSALTVGLGFTGMIPLFTHLCIDTCSWVPGRSWRWESSFPGPPQTFVPEFIAPAGMAYQEGTGPDRLGSGYCFSLSYRNEPPYWNQFGTIVTGNTCQTISFPFVARDPEGDPIVEYQLMSGPGTIVASTGLWTWNDVGIDDVGTHSVGVRARDDVSGGWSPTFILSVQVTPPSGPDLTAGCATDVLLTNVPIGAQMATATSCDDNVWSLTQYKGPLTGATCTIDNTGMIDFIATDPGLYEYRVFVNNGASTDSCLHSFIVHGGAGCCSAGRGNVDGVAGVDLSDLSRMISYMYNANTILGCWDEANVNGAGIIDLTDLSILISYLTIPGSVTLANCP